MFLEVLFCNTETERLSKRKPGPEPGSRHASAPLMEKAKLSILANIAYCLSIKEEKQLTEQGDLVLARG